MSWTYQQATGKLIDEDGYLWGIGYSGLGNAKNAPEFQNVHDGGPIPQWAYVIGAPHDSQTHGPFVLPLIPLKETNVFGRDAFLIHGDSLHTPGSASHGCIIMSRAIREKVWQSGDHALQVVSGLPDVTTETRTT